MILFQKYQKGKLSQLAGASNCKMLLNKNSFETKIDRFCNFTASKNSNDID